MPKGKGKGKGKTKKDDNNKKDSEKESIKQKIDKHPGYSCLYLGDKELTGYGFKTGDGLLDVAPFKTLKKTDILEEIAFKGKMCAFQPFTSFIEKYENEDILFVWDPDEEKEIECNFYFCNTSETFEAEKERLGISGDGLVMDPEEIKRKKLEEEEEKKRKKEEEERKKEEERIFLAINELKKPLIARPWKDLGSFEEIINNKIKSNRMRIRISISRKRKYFGKNISFSDQENVDGMNIEIKSLQTGSSKYGYDIYKKLTDKNNQIGNKMCSKSIQTKWYRKINKIIQYEFNEESIKNINNTNNNNLDSNISTQTMTESFDYNNNKNGNNINVFGFDDDLKSTEHDIANNTEHDIIMNEEDDINEKLEQFLDDIYPELADILTDNNLVNIFEDDFNSFIDGDGDLGIDTKTENIKEIQTFVDLNWSRGKKISDIQWIPSSNMIAVSCIENMSFDERVNIMNKSRISTILLWNLSHILLKAQTILTAPTDIFTFKFHPNNKNIIIGGLETGQVVLWDLNDLNKKEIDDEDKGKDKDKDKKKEEIDVLNPLNPLNINDNDDDDDESSKIPQIEPKMLSYIERSHTKCVTDILWLPSDIIITPSGELKYINIKNRPKGSKMLNEEQFMSISGDGNILFWDIQIPKQTEKEKKKNEPAKWIPIYSKKIIKTDLNENIFIDKEAMDLANYDPNNNNNDDDDDDDTADNNNNINDDDNNKEEGGGGGGANGTSSDTIFGCKMCYTPLLGKLCVGTELGEYCLFNYGKISKQLIKERESLLLRRNDSATTTTSYLLSTDDNDNNKGDHNKTKNDNNNDDNKLLLRLSSSTSQRILNGEHFLDIKSISASPHFTDIYLTIGDWRFCIWRNNKLIFESPYLHSYICCGCWSPTRPAVIITAKYDGTIDIWDLLDQTHCAVFKNSPISSTSITSIIFSKTNIQQLAVGDSNGNLRILQIPRNFVIPLNNEKLLMAQFYKKEYIKIKFINKRYQKNKIKTIEIKKVEKEKKEQKENNDKDEEEEKKQYEKESNINDNDDDDEINKQKQNDEKLEKKYQNMLVAFKKQLGIKNDE